MRIGPRERVRPSPGLSTTTLMNKSFLVLLARTSKSRSTFREPGETVKMVIVTKEERLRRKSVLIPRERTKDVTDVQASDTKPPDRRSDRESFARPVHRKEKAEEPPGSLDRGRLVSCPLSSADSPGALP